MTKADTILAARYALGVADASEVAAAEARIVADDAFAAEVGRLEATFDGLHDDIPPMAPGAGLWDRIDAAIDSAEAAKAPRTIDPRTIAWRPIAPNLEHKILHTDAATGARMVLYRAGPGAFVPAHRNVVTEECLVLEGEIEIGDKTLRAGDMQIVHAGTMHTRISSRAGAVIYIRENSASA